MAIGEMCLEMSAEVQVTGRGAPTLPRENKYGTAVPPTHTHRHTNPRWPVGGWHSAPQPKAGLRQGSENTVRVSETKYDEEIQRVGGRADVAMDLVARSCGVWVASKVNKRRSFAGAMNLLSLETIHQLRRLWKTLPGSRTPFLLEGLVGLQKHLILPGSPLMRISWAHGNFMGFLSSFQDNSGLECHMVACDQGLS